MTQSKSIVLAIDDVETGLVEALNKHGQRLGRKLEGIVLVNAHYPNFRERNRDPSGTFKEILVDFDKPDQIKAALEPYRDRLLTVTCRQESSIDNLRKVVPWLPDNLAAPSADSLLWSTEKKLMRDKVSAYESQLTPRYYYLTQYDEEAVETIINEVDFPVIVKPNGLRASILVTHCHNPEELRKSLHETFDVIKMVYERDTGHGEPSLLVEEMIQGEMYSTDAYVDKDGNIQCLPIVKVITAHAIGLPGFYSYQLITPTDLNKDEIKEAFKVTRKSITALELRSTTTHVELFKTANGWKLIEIGPRIGGYREDLYRLAYGVDHYYNDLANRLNLPVDLPTKPLAHAIGINMYADKEGTIQSITGIEEARQLPGILYLNVHAKPGDEAQFAGKGGRLIVDGIMSGSDPKALLAQEAKIRELVKISIATER